MRQAECEIRGLVVVQSCLFQQHGSFPTTSIPCPSCPLSYTYNSYADKHVPILSWFLFFCKGIFHLKKHHLAHRSIKMSLILSLNKFKMCYTFTVKIRRGSWGKQLDYYVISPLPMDNPVIWSWSWRPMRTVEIWKVLWSHILHLP